MSNPNPPTEQLKQFQWKRGQSGNPLGGQKHDKEMKLIKAMTKKQVAEVGDFLLSDDYCKLLEYSEMYKQAKDGQINTSGVSILQCMVASLALKAIKGDTIAFKELMDRIVGKVKEEVEHSGNLALPQVVIQLEDNGRAAKVPVNDTAVIPEIISPETSE